MDNGINRSAQSSLIARLRAMPSSLNDSCRTMDEAAVEIERLTAFAAPLQDGVRERLTKVRNWLDVQFREPFDNAKLSENIGILNDILAGTPDQVERMATPQEVQEACAQAADRAAEGDEAWAARWPDEAVKCGDRAHRAKTIAASIRALPITSAERP